MDASVQYQSSERGVILPLFAFAPMTEPANPDKWEPMKTQAENLLVVSIERHLDAKILKALKRAERILGPALLLSPSSPVQMDHALPIADVYRQMDECGVKACYYTGAGKDDMSFFFFAGRNAVIAFDTHLRAVTGKG